MTTPPPGATSGFESGDDFVAARVTIDIPTEGIAGLREITQEMDRFRTSVEAANRSSDTFASYLQRIAEAAQQAATAQENLVSMLERGVDFQNRSVVAGAGGPQPQLNAAPQYTDPFAAQTLGLGLGGGGLGPGSVQDVNTELETLKNVNPRAYINKMAASGQYRMGDIPAASPTGTDIQSAANRISQRSQLQEEGVVGESGMGDIGSRAGRMGAIAQQVLNEIQPGANPMGIPGMIQRGLSAAGNLGAGYGLSRLAGVAAPIAGAVGVGLAGYGLVQGAGSVYQDYKNIGSIRGGGAGEGVGYEMAIRSMAMNPFISSDQARQIVQQGLRDGYTGKEFDTITAMVAQNLKDFNIQVGDSFAMLRKNVLEGGQSGAAFGSNMESLKQLAAQGGYLSLPALQQNYAATSAALIDAGMPGNQAGQAAMVGANAFANDPLLAGKGGEMFQNFINNPSTMAQMKNLTGINVPSNMLPGAMAMSMSEEALVGGSEQLLALYARQALGAMGNPKEGTTEFKNAAYTWWNRAVRAGARINQNEALAMFTKLVKGEKPFTESQKEVEKTQEQQREVKDQGRIPTALGGIVSGAAAIGTGVGDLIANIGGTIKDYATGNSDHVGQRWSEVMDRFADRDAYTESAFSRYKLKALDKVRDAWGAGNVDYVQNGKSVNFDPTNEDQMKAVAGGQIKLRPRGASGEGNTVAELQRLSDDQLKQFRGGDRVSGEVLITLDPNAKKFFNAPSKIPLNPHTEQANRSWGNAAPNNAPPGYDGPR